MYMGKISGVNLYKHGITQRYLNLSDQCECYVSRGEWRYEPEDFAVELGKLVASLRKLGETLATAYDDQYVAGKDRVLQEAGIPVLRIKMQPEEFSVN
jgi:hypothetical protein